MMRNNQLILKHTAEIQRCVCVLSLSRASVVWLWFSLAGGWIVGLSLPLLCVLLGWCSVLLLWAGCLDVLLLNYHWQRCVYRSGLSLLLTGPSLIFETSWFLSCFFILSSASDSDPFSNLYFKLEKRIRNTAAVTIAHHLVQCLDELLWCNGLELLKTYDE